MLSIVEDGAVLLHLKRGIYFGLNPVGADIWDMLGRGICGQDCVAQLTKNYAIDDGRATADYQYLISELLDQGLIETS